GAESHLARADSPPHRSVETPTRGSLLPPNVEVSPSIFSKQKAECRAHVTRQGDSAANLHAPGGLSPCACRERARVRHARRGSDSDRALSRRIATSRRRKQGPGPFCAPLSPSARRTAVPNELTHRRVTEVEHAPHEPGGANRFTGGLQGNPMDEP